MEKLAYKGGKHESKDTTKRGKRYNTYCTCYNNHCAFNSCGSNNCDLDGRKSEY